MMEALALARATREEHARMRKDLKKGPRREAEQRCADLIEDFTELQGRIRMHFLLRAISRWGPRVASKVCRWLGIPEDKRLCELSPRQKDLLTRYLRGDQPERDALHVSLSRAGPALSNGGSYQ